MRCFVETLITIWKLCYGTEKNIDSCSDLLMLKPGKAYQMNFPAKDEALRTVVCYMRHTFNSAHV